MLSFQKLYCVNNMTYVTNVSRFLKLTNDVTIFKLSVHFFLSTNFINAYKELNAFKTNSFMFSSTKNSQISDNFDDSESH